MAHEIADHAWFAIERNQRGVHKPSNDSSPAARSAIFATTCSIAPGISSA